MSHSVLTHWPHLRDLARSPTIHSLAGFIAGLIAGGIGSRIAMRVSAITAGGALEGSLTEANNVVGRITPGGTFLLLILAGLIGTTGGIVYLAVRPWLADIGRGRGIAFGLLLLAMLGAFILRGRNFDFSLFGPPILNVTMFGAVFVLFGLFVPPLADRLELIERGLPPLSLRRSGLISMAVRVFGLIFMTGSLAFLALTILGFGPGRPEVQVLLAYVALCVPIAAALLARVSGPFERLSDLRGHTSATATAYGVLALPVVVGLALDAQEIIQIFGANG
jgi:hypothetical protein